MIPITLAIHIEEDLNKNFNVRRIIKWLLFT